MAPWRGSPFPRRADYPELERTVDADASVYVPLSLLSWMAAGHFSGPQPGIFSGADDGSSITDATVYPVFPIWP